MGRHLCCHKQLPSDGMGQDAEMHTGLRGGRSDPKLASQEVSETLAAVQGHFLDDNDDTVTVFCAT